LYFINLIIPLKSFFRFVVTVLAVMITQYIMQPAVQVNGIWTAIVVAAIIGLLNAFLKPILVILTIPITLFSFGLFLLVINGIIVAIAVKLVPGFEVRSFGWAIFFSIVLSILNAFLEGIFGLKEQRDDNEGA